MKLDETLDNGLVRALRGGHAALPECPRRLAGYLRTIERLLAEKAREHEPNWDEACAAAKEIETLQALATAVAERVIALRGQDLPAVLAKLALWRDLAPAGEDDACARDLRDRLILSVEADLVRLDRGRRACERQP
jgi:hypothetical protein